MLEYFVYALLGAVIVGCLLYVTMSSEVEEPPSSKQPVGGHDPDR
jgi:hypothetical protein